MLTEISVIPPVYTSCLLLANQHFIKPVQVTNLYGVQDHCPTARKYWKLHWWLHDFLALANTVVNSTIVPLTNLSCVRVCMSVCSCATDLYFTWPRYFQPFLWWSTSCQPQKTAYPESDQRATTSQTSRLHVWRPRRGKLYLTVYQLCDYFIVCKHSSQWLYSHI